MEHWAKWINAFMHFAANPCIDLKGNFGTKLTGTKQLLGLLLLVVRRRSGKAGHQNQIKSFILNLTFSETNEKMRDFI